MRTLRAILIGFLFSSAMIIGGAWLYTLVHRPDSAPGYLTTGLLAAIVSLVFICAAVVGGARIATRIDDTPPTFSGYIVFELFFGLGLTGRFLDNGGSWMTQAAVILVIPCTMFGRALARRRIAAISPPITHPANR